MSPGSIVTVLVITTVTSLAKTKDDPSAVEQLVPAVGADRREIPVDVPGVPERR